MISNLSLRFWFVVVLFVSIQLSPALSEGPGGSSLGGGAIGESTGGGMPEKGQAEAAQQQVKDARPDGSTITKGDGGSIEIQYPGGTSSASDLMGSGDWNVSYKDCPDPTNVTVKPAVKECRADITNKKGSLYEIQYLEFNCAGLNPSFRRLPISFKKLGPCTRKEYDDAKDKAATYGETWPPGNEVQFAETDQGGAGLTVVTDYGGWMPRTVATWDKSIDVVWDKDGNQYTATYYPNGTSAWTYKGDKPDYPKESPPALPTIFGGQDVKFKTVTTEQPGKAEEPKKEDKKAASSGGKAKSTEKSANKSDKGKGKAASKTSKGAKAGKALKDNAGTIREGVTLGLGIAGSVQKSKKSNGMMKSKKGMGMY